MPIFLRSRVRQQTGSFRKGTIVWLVVDTRGPCDGDLLVTGLTRGRQMAQERLQRSVLEPFTPTYIDPKRDYYGRMEFVGVEAARDFISKLDPL